MYNKREGIYDERLQNAFRRFHFVLKLKKQRDQRIDGDGLWSCLSFVIGMGVT